MPELAEYAKNGKFLIYNADPKSDQGKTPYTTEAEWKDYLEDRRQRGTEAAENATHPSTSQSGLCLKIQLTSASLMLSAEGHTTGQMSFLTT